MAKTITMVCTLSPRPGKLPRVEEILTSLAKNVHKNENGCVKYLVLRQTSANAERPDMVLIEEWLSQDDLENHHKQVYLKDTHKALEEEDLLVEPEVIKVVEQVWGFEGRRSQIVWESSNSSLNLENVLAQTPVFERAQTQTFKPQETDELKVQGTKLISFTIDCIFSESIGSIRRVHPILGDDIVFVPIHMSLIGTLIFEKLPDLLYNVVLIFSLNS
ncbi:dTDP-4-amino-4,6-dideoxygalactose transaminase [Physcia stellaris]|nr:dTDP-4-amino-4,6-dideoxygalactose transaminase [Physcia stellaris]